MATPTRVYIVTIGDCDRLVRATHPSAALMHVARDIAAVGVASQDELIDCLADGIKVENIKEEAAEPAPKADAPSLPLWPMPTQASYSPPEDEDDQADEDDEDELPDNRAAGVPKRQRVAAKYRCPMTGSTWSGRGLKPTWLRVALDAGKQLADFEVTAQPA